MKRTKSINLDAMRKPLGIGIAVAGSTLLSGCSDDARVFETVAQCVDVTRCEENCTAAYQQAKQESARTAPQYRRKDDCEYEFGIGECSVIDTGQVSPRMAGFMMLEELDCRSGGTGTGGYSHRYFGRSVYSPRSTASPGYGRWVTGDGDVLGSRLQSNVSVPGNTFDQAPSYRPTLSRGGFGSTIRTRSSSGGSWGG